MFIQLRALLTHLFRKDEGATAVEYGVMVAAIVAVIVTVVIALGQRVDDAFTDTCTSVDAVTDGTTAC